LKKYKYFLKDFELEKNKKNVAKHEISKWHPNSRWTPKGFYRLKLINLIFKKKNFFLKIQNGRNIQYGRFFCTKVHDFVEAETPDEMF
jgi:hypothetical protein